MNKRKFLEMLGIGVVTAPAIPNLVRDLETGKPVIPASKKAIISESPTISFYKVPRGSASGWWEPPSGLDIPAHVVENEYVLSSINGYLGQRVYVEETGKTYAYDNGIWMRQKPNKL